MQTEIQETTMAGAKAPKTPRDQHLSKDGKWRYFPKVPNLLQYVRTGTYFARAKIQRKTIRQSLETDVFTTAKLRLADKIKEFRKPPPDVGTFAEARALYETDLEAEHTLADQSRRYRKNCIAVLLRTWPGLDEAKLPKISECGCREWAKRFAAEHDEQYFNNTLGTLRAILERGGIGHDANPARKIKRLGVKPKQLQLPEPEQFQKLLQTIETSGAGAAQKCADFVRFLAFSGCRLSEARKVLWTDIDWQRSEIKIHNAKRSKTSGAHEIRFLPIIPPMRELLERLKGEPQPSPSDRVCLVGECEKSLTRACRMVEIPRITHHDLRHLFATRCIEAGVDIPTVARWLGHVDGGALAMRVYGHLRREHSAAMAQRVTFGQIHADQ